MKQLVMLSLVFVAFPAFAKKKEPTLFDSVKQTANEAMTAPPKENEVCFSPENLCDVKFWKFLQTAQKSLDIAIFDITHEKIVHEILVAKVSRKIPVRVVVDTRQSKGQHSLVSLLIKGGANVRFGKQRGVMHNKFTILDGKMLQTGSFNYTNAAATKNNENQIYLSNPAIIEQYQKRFEELWQNGRPPAAVR